MITQRRRLIWGPYLVLILPTLLITGLISWLGWSWWLLVLWMAGIIVGGMSASGFIAVAGLIRTERL